MNRGLTFLLILPERQDHPHQAVQDVEEIQRVGNLRAQLKNPAVPLDSFGEEVERRVCPPFVPSSGCVAEACDLLPEIVQPEFAELPFLV